MKRETTAYHEAGHAVVDYRFNFYSNGVTIIPDAEKGTCGTQIGEEPFSEEDRVADHIVSLYAGGVAQRRFNRASGEEGCGQDDKRANNLLQTWPNLNESELRQRAEELVDKHWPEIKAVAEALLDEETLSSDDAEYIMDVIEEGGDWRSQLAYYRKKRVGG